MKTFEQKLEEAKGIADVFELVKESVRKVYNAGRSGLSLGLAELGGSERQVIGAFYPMGSNIIIMNKTLLRNITDANPELYKPYVYHVLMHEYFHTLGFVDERAVRALTYKVSTALFGEEHIATRIAKEPGRFLANLVYPHGELGEEEDLGLNIELVKDFDKSSTTYIG